MVQSAQASGRNDDVPDLGADSGELRTQVGDRRSISIDPHEQPAGSLDEDKVDVFAFCDLGQPGGMFSDGG